MSEEFQQTLKSETRFSGIGLHTGERCELKIFPTEADFGVWFRIGETEIPASVEYVRGTLRGTSVSKDGVEVYTVEHLLAAISGMRIDNLLIEVYGPEVPIADGSALPFVELFESVGLAKQNSPTRNFSLKKPACHSHADKYLVATPSADFRIKSFISFNHPMIGEQAVSLCIEPEIFKREIAPARTFCTSSEIDSILALGLGKGGTKDNVVVAYDDHFSVPLRYEDEFVRHKVLDVIGDLFLIGGRMNADVTAIKSSHELNINLVNKIISNQESKGG